MRDYRDTIDDRLSSTRVFQSEIRNNPAILSGFDATSQQVPFLRTFIDGDYWRRALAGQIPLSEADEALQAWFKDYEALFRLLHNQPKDRMLLQTLFKELELKLYEIVDGIRTLHVETQAAQTELDKRRKELRRQLKDLGISESRIRNILKQRKAKEPTTAELAKTITSTSLPELKELGLSEILPVYMKGVLDGRRIQQQDDVRPDPLPLQRGALRLIFGLMRPVFAMSFSLRIRRA